jgi:hypothetical protein
MCVTGKNESLNHFGESSTHQNESRLSDSFQVAFEPWLERHGSLFEQKVGEINAALTF